MLTSTEYREWLLEQIDSLTKWSQPEADLNVCQDAADIVRESGEIALRLGLPDSYRDCRVATNLLAIPVAKEILGRCLVACGTVTDAVTEEPKEVPKSACKLIYERAYRQFEVAEAALGSVTDKQAYDWFKTHERKRGIARY